MLEQLAESVLITDASGRILYVNQAFEHLTGYSREEVLGQNPRFLKSGAHSQEFYRMFWSRSGPGFLTGVSLLTARRTAPCSRRRRS
ncbi:PAS domain-containing protein [Thermus scotoductus]|uniref:PAS domain-containing protein n=1 Tax=Thermus scotoductus TaxID=37636 RepID=UPI00345407EA